jgi:hypothetical protein
MIDVIKQIPNYQSLTAQQIVDYLAEEAVNVNMKGWTPTSMEKEGGLMGVEVDLLLETLRLSSGRGASAFQWLSTNPDGLELGSQERQDMVDFFAVQAEWESKIPGMTARVKALGRTTQARYLTMGLASLPTIEQIEDALNPDFDSESVEVLFSLNRQANGQTFVVMRSTPVKLRNGVVVERGEGTNFMDSPLITQVKELIEASL